jgi:hypothetical protein
LVHDDSVPPSSTQEIRLRATAAFPHVYFWTLQRTQFARLATALSCDFWEEAVQLAPLDAYHELPSLTVRDAFEVAIAAFAEYFGHAIASRCMRGEISVQLAYEMNRIALNALRSVIMLNGGFSYHDRSCVLGRVGDLVQAELDWRDCVTAPPRQDLARLLLILACVLDYHQRHGYGCQYSNAVDGSQFADRPGADFVTAYQEFVLDLLRATLVAVGDPRDARAVWDGECRAWEDTLRRCAWMIRATPHPAPFFQQQASCYAELLLQMKLP